MCDIYVQPICQKFTGMNYHLLLAKGIFPVVKAVKNIVLFCVHEKVIKPQLKSHITLRYLRFFFLEKNIRDLILLSVAVFTQFIIQMFYKCDIKHLGVLKLSGTSGEKNLLSLNVCINEGLSFIVLQEVKCVEKLYFTVK